MVDSCHERKADRMVTRRKIRGKCQKNVYKLFFKKVFAVHKNSTQRHMDKVKKNISHSILIRLHQPRINISSTYRDYISKIIATTNFLL